MAYNNGYDRGGWYPANPMQHRGYYPNQRRSGKKRSGAKQGVDAKGKFWVNAWNASKDRGLIVVSAFENSRSTRSESKAGNKFVTMMFEIVYRKTGAKLLEVANYNVSTGKVYLNRLGMVISTKAPNGGYMGKIKS